MAWAIASTQPMQQNKLFNQTRLQLAGWYAGVMGTILGLAGVVTYQMVAHTHWELVRQELQAVAGTLHDSVEPKLNQPGQLTPAVQTVLPNLCVVAEACVTTSEHTGRHTLNVFQQSGYYIQFFDQSGRLLAIAGQPPGERSPQLKDQFWQTLTSHSGTRYQQFSLLLKTTYGTPWGYMQLGRSLKEFDEHLAFLRFSMFTGLPIVILLVAGASWALAGVSMRPIYRSYERMQQFTADAAHELRTPIATIKAIVESTRGVNPLTEAEALDALAGVDRQNERLVKLAQDLLLLSQLQVSQEITGKSLLVPNHLLCLNDLVIDLVESLSVLEIAAPIKLRTQLRVQESLYVTGNEDQLIRLVSNLVMNALQYTPPGGTVTVSLGRDDHQALIQVQDTGVGIAPNEQPHIFDRFYRVSRDRSRHTGGAGLGLPIAQAIAQAHRGSIHVHSELGRGSLFTVRLPLISHTVPPNHLPNG